jgi:hypothetical protein
VISPRRVLAGILVLFTTLGLAAAAEVEPPWTWFLAAFLMAAVGAGATALTPSRVTERQPLVGLLPSLLVLVVFVLLAQPWATEDVVRYGGSVVGGCLLAGALLASVLDESHRHHLLVRRAMLVLLYLLAFAMYTVIYTTRVRSFFTATAVGLMTLLVAFAMFYEPERDLTRTGLYTLVCGLILGQVTWVLNYWIIGGLTAGAFLLLVLYACTGVLRAQMAGLLTNRLALEYAVVMSVGFVLVAVLVSSQPTV